MRHTLKADIYTLVAGSAKMVSEISALTFVRATFAKLLDINEKRKPQQPEDL